MRLDTTSDQTLRRSLSRCVRTAIADGSIKPGARLPSTRLLAAELGVSRNTISDAFAQLVAEGFLVARHGAGTFVAALDEPVRPPQPPVTAWERASERGKLFAALPTADTLTGRATLPFQPGLPAYEHFPSRMCSGMGTAPDTRRCARPSPRRCAPAAAMPVATSRSSSWAAPPRRSTSCPVSRSIRAIGSGSRIPRRCTRARRSPAPVRRWFRFPWTPKGSTSTPASQPRRSRWSRPRTNGRPVRRSRHVAARACSRGPMRRTRGSSRTSTTAFSGTTGLVEAFTAAKATVDRQASLFVQAILAEFIYDGLALDVPG